MSMFPADACLTFRNLVKRGMSHRAGGLWCWFLKSVTGGITSRTTIYLATTKTASLASDRELYTSFTLKGHYGIRGCIIESAGRV